MLHYVQLVGNIAANVQLVGNIAAKHIDKDRLYIMITLWGLHLFLCIKFDVNKADKVAAEKVPENVVAS